MQKGPYKGPFFSKLKSGWRDSNSRSSGPKPDALDQLGHTPLYKFCF